MSERGSDIYRPSKRTPERRYFEDGPEVRPELEPDLPRCEARVTCETIQEEIATGVYDILGNRIGLPEWVDQPGIIETTIDCTTCPLSETFKSEGMGMAPSLHSAIEVNRMLQNCPKLIARGYTPGQIPKELLPE